MDPVLALRFVSFFASSIVCFFAIRRGGGWLLVSVPLLFNPRVLDLFTAQQRFALALCLFILIIELIKERRLFY